MVFLRRLICQDRSLEGFPHTLVVARKEFDQKLTSSVEWPSLERKREREGQRVGEERSGVE